MCEKDNLLLRVVLKCFPRGGKAPVLFFLLAHQEQEKILIKHPSFFRNYTDRISENYGTKMRGKNSSRVILCKRPELPVITMILFLDNEFLKHKFFKIIFSKNSIRPNKQVRTNIAPFCSTRKLSQSRPTQFHASFLLLRPTVLCENVRCTGSSERWYFCQLNTNLSNSLPQSVSTTFFPQHVLFACGDGIFFEVMFRGMLSF